MCCTEHFVDKSINMVLDEVKWSLKIISHDSLFSDVQRWCSKNSSLPVCPIELLIEFNCSMITSAVESMAWYLVVYFWWFTSCLWCFQRLFHLSLLTMQACFALILILINFARLRSGHQTQIDTRGVIWNRCSQRWLSAILHLADGV